jgi:ribosomal-protein-alanine N-acetyltransferase
MTPSIETARLTLIPLTLQQLGWCLPAPEPLEASLGFSVSREMLADPVPRAIAMKLSRMAETPIDEHPWLTYWLIVVRRKPFGAGMVGFKGRPDGEGKTEVGYGIDPAYRRQGYMTEAVRAMIDWAFGHNGCRIITAEGVLRDNIASRRVLEKVGMMLYREEGDELCYWLRK